jgi:hypothetical protein
MTILSVHIPFFRRHRQSAVNFRLQWYGINSHKLDSLLSHLCLLSTFHIQRSLETSFTDTGTYQRCADTSSDYWTLFCFYALLIPSRTVQPKTTYTTLLISEPNNQPYQLRPFKGHDTLHTPLCHLPRYRSSPSHPPSYIVLTSAPIHKWTPSTLPLRRFRGGM